MMPDVSQTVPLLTKLGNADMLSRVSLHVAVALAVLSLTGCPPRVVVKQNPGPRDQGVRYYRPKPYLLVTPYQFEQVVDRTILLGPPSDQYVTIGLQYLPDFGEEYSIHVRTGLGTADVELQLEDGWNLTAINQDLDSQFDENISAVADLLGAAAPQGIVPTPRAGERLPPPHQTVVRASNVPLGYYEAVIGRSPAGPKQLYGWRYIGFLPYQHCPVEPCGLATEPCETLDLYGLVFDNGVMTFRPLYDVQQRIPPASYPVGPQ